MTTKKELIHRYVLITTSMHNKIHDLNVAMDAIYEDNRTVSVIPTETSRLINDLLKFICTEYEIDWLSYYIYEQDAKPFIYWQDDVEVQVTSFDDFYNRFFDLQD